jgi:hypothetical protein
MTHNIRPCGIYLSVQNLTSELSLVYSTLITIKYRHVPETIAAPVPKILAIVCWAVKLSAHSVCGGPHQDDLWDFWLLFYD